MLSLPSGLPERGVQLVANIQTVGTTVLLQTVGTTALAQTVETTALLQTVGTTVLHTVGIAVLKVQFRSPFRACSGGIND